ncbi:MAG: glycosyltransferase family 4 protein [Butyrivibrio sp.]|nr:glycosyltransferase family 4 protein [Butyrivibrio sp.]
MNITFLKLYITDELNSSFYNSQEIGLAKAVTEVYPEHRVNIVLLSRGEGRVEKITDKVTLHVMKAKGVGHHGMLRRGVAGEPDNEENLGLDLIKELKTDVLHLLADNMLYAPNVIRYCRKNGIKYHLYIGTLFTDSNKWYRKALDRLMMSRNIAEYRRSPVYVKTPGVQRQCQELGIKAELAPVGLNKEDVVLSERPVEEIRGQYGIPADKKVLLFVGRLEEYKHPLDAVEALRMLNVKGAKASAENTDHVDGSTKYHLVVVGKGALEDALKAMTTEYSLTESVTLLPKVPNTEMKHLYKACDYFVNFNPDEIYGMSILEAMAHKCLVLAINAPGPDFLIKDGETGYLCESVEAMTQRIRKIAQKSEAGQQTNPETDWSDVTSNARDYVSAHLTWDKLVYSFKDFSEMP